MKSLAAILGLCGLSLAWQPAMAFQDEGTVRIGSIESQTGVVASYGIQSRNGMRLGVDAINAAGGVKVGGKMVKLAITPEPNGYDPADDTVQNLALFKKLVFDDQVLAVKGTTRSVATEMIFNYLGELDKQGAGTVLLSNESSTPGLGGKTRWGFRSAFFESNQIDHELGLLKEKFGIQRVALFVIRDNGFNVATADGVIVPLLKQHGLDLVASVDGFEKRPSDFSREVNDLRAANADLIILSASVLPSVNLMKEAARRGLKPKLWLGTVAQLSPEVPELGGKAVEHLVVGAAYSPAAPVIRKLQDEYKQRFGAELGQFAVTGYDAAYLIKQAIEDAGIANTPETLAADRVKFRDAMAKVSITGANGQKLSFAANGDAVMQGAMLTVRDGKFVDWDGNALP